MSEKKRILVVDDEPDFAEVVRINLEREGFSVEVAGDGQEGLRRVKEDPPDAIILDVMMPGMDGYAVCSALKSSKQYAHIPVLVLTAVASRVPSTRYSHLDGMLMEADEYLPKPASAELITRRLKGMLGI